MVLATAIILKNYKEDYTALKIKWNKCELMRIEYEFIFT
jgi:hypothetical protein